MNNVTLIGRLTKDPEIRYTTDNLAICNFTLAVDRFKKGEEKEADFIPVVVFGRQAENCEKYLRKGLKTAIEGHIQTGSYTNDEGRKVYTTKVVANRVEFIDWGNDAADVPKGFEEVKDDDMPF